ncbi:hypothetical protein V8C86DRAFT_1017020 [Haematococcus lacustris]
MGDTDSDSPPLIHRTRRAPGRPSSPAPTGSQVSKDEDDLPDWAQNFKSPYTIALAASSPDDDDMVDLTGSQLNAPAHPKSLPAPLQPETTHGAQPPKVQTRQPTAPASLASIPAASKRGSAQPVKLATPSVSVTPAGPAAPSAPALPPSSTAAVGQASAAARGGVGVKAASPIKAKLPLLLPDKVPRNKALLELVAGGDEAVVDLAGDAGAVGRLSVTGKAGSEELVVDLKGVMFAATILPLAVTAMVINIQPNGAKVEAVFNDFVRLSELRGGWGEEEGEGAGLTSLLAEEDDEEHYMLQGEGEAAEGEVTDGSGRKKPAKKAKTGSSKAAGGSAKKGGSKPAAATAGKPASKGSASGKGGGKTKAGGMGGTRGVKKAAGKKGRG